MSPALAATLVALCGAGFPDSAGTTPASRNVTFLAPVGGGMTLPVAGVPIPRLRVRAPSPWAAAAPAPAPLPGDAAPPADPAPDDAPPGDAPPTPPDEPAPPDAPADDPGPADPPPSDTPPDDVTPGDAGTPAAEPGAMSIDDIFGTSDTHTDVKVVSEAPTADAPAAETPAAGSTKTKAAKFLDKLDTRIRIVSSAYFDTARVEERGFGRNENRLEFYFAYTPNDHIQIVGDIEPVFFGVSQTRELDDLASQRMLTPFHVESDAAYIAINDILPRLDLKIGRQVLVWGTADKFNPTSNISPDDLEDRPLFTEPIGNQMVVVDYAPLDDKLWFQGVYVPIFFPALLPPSAAAALKDPNAVVPFARQSDLDKIDELQQLIEIQPMLEPELTSHVKTPRPRFTNGQSAIKVGTSLGGVDMSLSYYNGRHDIPTPILAESNDKDPDEGTGVGCCFTSDVTLIYPRMQVIGFDFTTQLPFLKNLGLWGEGGLFIPQPQELRIEFPIMVDVTPDDGVTNPVMEMSGPTVRSTPFIKATAGFDYTFGKHVYVQMQYLRGFIDEFGADHIGNYLVGGTDLVFFGRHLILRAFGVVDFPTGRGDNASYVIYPELAAIPPWGFVTFSLGSFFLLGQEDTKFGQRAAGSSIVFFKVVGQF